MTEIVIVDDINCGEIYEFDEFCWFACKLPFKHKGDHAFTWKDDE